MHMTRLKTTVIETTKPRQKTDDKNTQKPTQTQTYASKQACYGLNSIKRTVEYTSSFSEAEYSLVIK